MRVLSFWLCSFLSLSVGIAWAEDAPRPAAPAEPAPAEKPAADQPAEGTDDIAELIKQLDANSFVKRQAASVKLAALGKAAIPALQEASLQGIREVTTRAIAVLKQHYQGADPELKQAAKEALEKIAATEGAPTAAERAKEALAPKPDPMQPQFGQGGFGQGGIQIFPGQAQIQIRVQAIGGPNAKRISVKNINGVKEVEAEENGRKIKINEDANGGIKLEITKQKDGKEETEKIEAKNADELKKNHPEAHKIYEEYSQGGGQIQIQAIPFGPNGALPIPVPGQPIPLPAQRIRPLPLRPAGMDAEAQKKLDEAQKQLKDAVDRLRAAAQANDQETLKQANEDLQAAQKAIQEAIRARVRPALPENVPLPLETPAPEKKPA